MVLTPLDIHNKEFKRGFRGYSEEKVDEFLDKVAKDYESMYKENLELKEHLDKKEDNIVKYKEIEETIKDTLVVAQQTAQDVKGNSQKEAELLLKKAQNDAKELYAESQREAERLVSQAKNQSHDIVTEAKKQVKTIMSEYEKMISKYNQFHAKYKALLNVQMELLQSGDESVEGNESKQDWNAFDSIAASEDNTNHENYISNKIETNETIENEFEMEETRSYFGEGEEKSIETEIETETESEKPLRKYEYKTYDYEEKGND